MVGRTAGNRSAQSEAKFGSGNAARPRKGRAMETARAVPITIENRE